MANKRSRISAPEASPTASAFADPPRASDDASKTSSSTVDPDVNDPDVLVLMKTTYASQFRVLFDTLKDLLPELPLTFEADKMRITCVDGARIALCHVVAHAEVYVCREPPFIAGINMTALYKTLRSLTTTGYILEFRVTKSDSDFITVRVVNIEKKTTLSHRIKLLRLPPQVITVPDTKFTRIMRMPASDWQRHVRELATLSAKIRISVEDDALVIESGNASGSTCVKMNPFPAGLNFLVKDDSDEGVVDGVFGARYLERFSKPLDSTVELYMRKNYPLVLKYTMPSCVVRFCLAPIQEDATDK